MLHGVQATWCNMVRQLVARPTQHDVPQCNHSELAVPTCGMLHLGIIKVNPRDLTICSYRQGCNLYAMIETHLRVVMYATNEGYACAYALTAVTCKHLQDLAITFVSIAIAAQDLVFLSQVCSTCSIMQLFRIRSRRPSSLSASACTN